MVLFLFQNLFYLENTYTSFLEVHVGSCRWQIKTIAANTVYIFLKQNLLFLSK